MRYATIVCLLSLHVTLSAQIFGSDSTVTANERIKRTFWSNSAYGRYLGYGRGKDLGVTSQTITLKLFELAYYFPFSMYAGYGQLQESNEVTHQLPRHNLHVGMTHLFWGAALNYYFGNGRSFFTFIPKISLDFGQLTLEYGYQLGKINGKPHYLKFSYSLLLKKP